MSLIEEDIQLLDSIKTQFEHNEHKKKIKIA